MPSKTLSMNEAEDLRNSCALQVTEAADRCQCFGHVSQGQNSSLGDYVGIPSSCSQRVIQQGLGIVCQDFGLKQVV